MKLCFLILSMITTLNTTGQETLSTHLEKSILYNLHFPVQVQNDSCLNESFLLRIKINAFNDLEFSFSDNTIEWFLEAFNKNKHKFDTAIIKAQLLSIHSDSKYVMVPIFIRNVSGLCRTSSINCMIDKRYFYFENKILSNNLAFIDPVEIHIHQANH